NTTPRLSAICAHLTAGCSHCHTVRGFPGTNVTLIVDVKSPFHQQPSRECNRLCLLKNLGSRHAFCPFWSPGYSLFSFFRPGSCSCNLRSWLTAEESHQPFQVLRRGRQVELLAHEAHPAQPQSAESDVILQLCEECFHF